MDERETGIYATGAPGMMAPGMTAPGMMAPGVMAPGMMAPGMVAPGVPHHVAVPLMQMLQMMEGALPIDQVIHSLHHQALMDPALRDHPAMLRFTDAGDRHLHAKIAVAGYIRRILSGEIARPVLAGLADQLREMERTHEATRAAVAQLAAADPTRVSDVIRGLGQVMVAKHQAVRTLLPMAQHLMSAVVAPVGAAPGLTTHHM